jgi:hypothetical protein
VGSYDNTVPKHVTKKCGKSFLKQRSPQTKKLSERDGFSPKRLVDDSEQDALQKVLARFQEKTFNRIMQQLYQT